jgi:hypothetical protein
VARGFVAASSQTLRRNGAPIRGVAPLSICAWIKPTAQTAAAVRVVGLYQDTPATAGIFSLRLETTGAPTAQTYDGTTNALATGATLVTAGVWQHVAATYASASSRSVYLNGANKVTNTATATPTNVVETDIGALWNASAPLLFFDGSLAEIATWSVALTDTDVAVLALGVSPLFVRPDALISYWPLYGSYSPEIDLVGRADLTVTGASVSMHPLVYFPVDQQIRVANMPHAPTFRRGLVHRHSREIL